MDFTYFAVGILSSLVGAAAGIAGYVQLIEKPNPVRVGVAAAKAAEPDVVTEPEPIAPISMAESKRNKLARGTSGYPPARKKSAKKRG